MPKHTSLDSTFHAIADPTRREVLSALAAGPQGVSELARPFGMALPSFLQHLGVLEQAGLIASEKRGRVRVCTLAPQAFVAAADWMAAERERWGARLDRLDDYLSDRSTP